MRTRLMIGPMPFCTMSAVEKGARLQDGDNTFCS